MIEVLGVEESGIPAAEGLVQRAFAAAVRQAGGDPAQVSATVVLTDDEELARLNLQFRQVSEPTDVLSFAVDGEDITGELQGYLGDVVISVERARAQAAEAGHSLEHELAVLVAHGALHLLGFDHAEEPEEREMFARQEAAAREATSA